jgi:hypothetical protein
MINTHKIAQQHGLSRKVLMVAHSKEDNMYKVHVEVSGMGRSELNYYFIEGGKTVGDACELASDIATCNFMGLVVSNSPKESASIPKLENKEEVSNASIEEKNLQKSGEEKPKADKKVRGQKSGQEKSLEKTPPPSKDEMVEVESPFKAEAPVESPKKEKSGKITAEPYNREDKQSKASFASYVTSLHGGSKDWKTREDLKEISGKLHGKPFIEKNGDIHPDFDAECKELFGLNEPAL